MYPGGCPGCSEVAAVLGVGVERMVVFSDGGDGEVNLFLVVCVAAER